MRPLENEPLPLDLTRLERDLAARSLAGPSAGLRSRILGDVRAGLKREPLRAWIPFVAEVAAAALLWINLSWAAVRSTDSGSWPVGEAEPVASESRRIQELVPELSAREAARAALVLHLASDLDRSRPFPLGLVGSGLPRDPERLTP